MAVKKIVISPNNTKAIAFFEELNRKKEDMFVKIEKIQLNKFGPKKSSK